MEWKDDGGLVVQYGRVKSIVIFMVKVDILLFFRVLSQEIFLKVLSKFLQITLSCFSFEMVIGPNRICETLEYSFCYVCQIVYAEYDNWIVQLRSFDYALHPCDISVYKFRMYIIWTQLLCSYGTEHGALYIFSVRLNISHQLEFVFGFGHGRIFAETITENVIELVGFRARSVLSTSQRNCYFL